MLGLLEHGGRVQAAEQRFGRPEQGWLDLSTGIAPFAYPLPEVPLEAWVRLPEAPEEAAARAAAAAACGAASLEHVALAPGSQALIQLLPRLIADAAARVVVLSPTYAEHAAAWAALGHPVERVSTLDALDASGGPIAVVGNPNNPDGRRSDPQRLARLGTALAAVGGMLVVDEAFADTTPALSLCGLEAPGVIVLRSFGKFYGLGGLRFGWAVCAPEMVRKIQRALGPWAVSGPALAIATRALADTAWAEAQRGRLTVAARQLGAVLVDAGLTPIGGTDLFALAAHPDAHGVWAALAERGVLTRAFAEHPTWLRIGVPADRAGLRRLAEALAEAAPR